MTFVLDVNVLVALAWPNHVHHALAHAWFGEHRAAGWATCPITESGFVRVSSNPAVPHAVTPAEALSLLGRMRDVEGHTFLDDDTSLAVSPHVDRGRIVTHGLVTDAHLLAVARRHQARVATLDLRARRALSRGPDDPSIVLIEAGAG